ncbi:conserved hypothetical protein [Neospora caninum Liverpool]|uniref:Uncharacterized protein n=1 Tax=Neospora caninum (strain Liverpool) TaxID=572307 RepID=F0VQS3_NEOCL|nr:conserved hypothetical protein [Neospora caninum Liverpool]CBZ56070.1 conserved hypothetical protein [Neospora caninum Liverpool]CEL70818.1 TPA: hypothetical protein BN1204_064960 [Neospora caninum Liverpool]|eukprot:XP_003886096.1 conserved hypothetical protein [Neospora caninum Liverpool]
MDFRNVIPSLLYINIFTMGPLFHEAALFVNGIPRGQESDATIASADEIIVPGLKSLELFNPQTEAAGSSSAQAAEFTLPIATTSPLHHPSKTWTRDPFLESTPPVAIGGAPLSKSPDSTMDPPGTDDFALLISRAKADFLASLPPSAMRQWMHWQKRGVQPSFFRRGEEPEEGGSPALFPIPLIQVQSTHEDQTLSSKKPKMPLRRKPTDGPGTYVPHISRSGSSSSLLSSSHESAKTGNSSGHGASANTTVAHAEVTPTLRGDPMTIVPAQYADEHVAVVNGEAAAPTSLHEAVERRNKTGVAPPKDGPARRKQIFRGRGGRGSSHTDDGMAASSGNT